MKHLHFNSCLLSFAALALPLAAQTLYLPSGTSGIGNNTANGNVGIDTNIPTAPLEVNSSSGILAKFTRPGAGPVIQVGASDSQAAWFGYVLASDVATMGTDDDPYSLAIKSNGNVGIGTTSPGTKLEVKAASNWRGIIRVNTGANQYSSFGWMIDDVPQWSAYVHPGSTPADSLFFANAAGADKFAIDQNGNVGIGTTYPGAKLDVVGGISMDDFSTFALRRSQGIGTYAIHFANAAPRYPIRFVGCSDSVTHRFFEFGYYTGDNQGNAWNANVVIDSYAGNVGIGTTNPTQKLSVNGTIQAKEVVVQTGWSDYVFKPDYKLASLGEVEGAIKRDGHLPGIPSAQEVAEHGVSMGDMQSKLLAKVEELTLHLIAQEKRLNEAYGRLQKVEAENAALRAGHHN